MRSNLCSRILQTDGEKRECQEYVLEFATRVPIFMYLTDYREQTLRDAITKLEPEPFKKVTGLNKHVNDAQVSLFDTAIPAQEFEEM